MLYHYSFSTRLLKTKGSDIFDVSKLEKVKDFIACHSFFKYNPISNIADPFLFVSDGKLFLFYEEQIVNRNAVIKMVSTEDLLSFSKPSLVLKEPFHLSFPCVFADDGVMYMLPETGGDNSIRLYYKKDNKFIFRKKLLSGDKFVDSSIIKYGSTYYLFTTKKVNGVYNLMLYYSNSLFGEFVEHPMAPIHIGDDYGRNAGAVFSYKGFLYRPSQICSGGRYGEGVALFKITALTQHTYTEVLSYPNILPKNNFYRYSGHQFSFAMFNGYNVIASDAKQKAINFFDILERIVKRL